MPPSAALRPALKRVFQSPIASHLPPTFLAPYFHNATKISPFSTTSPNSYPRHNKRDDGRDDKKKKGPDPRSYNRERGISAVRRTGPRKPLSVMNDPLPVPVLDPKKRSKLIVDEDHGLWDFFHSKEKPMNTPEEDAEFGRAWTVEELRRKSWADLHCLWWECVKERNRISTESHERERLEAGYGAYESDERDRAVRVTMRSIKHALTQRYYAWEEATKIHGMSGSGRQDWGGGKWEIQDQVDEEAEYDVQGEGEVQGEVQGERGGEATTPKTA